MPRALPVFKHSLTLLAACALLSSCQVASPTAQGASDHAKRESPMKAEREQAQALGLVTASGKLDSHEFQIKDADGLPVAGAVVVVNGHRLETDARGIVALPPELRESGEPLMATVEKESFVSTSFAMKPGYAFVATPRDTLRTALTPDGGVARNSGGTLEVTFPPGALAAGGEISVTRIYSETIIPGTPMPKIAFNDLLEPGTEVEVDVTELPVLGQYHYAIDLGDAELAPGSSYTVRFKVEGQMKEMLQMRLDRGDTLEHMVDAVSQDANGDYWLAMRVQGPAAAEAGGGKYGLLAAQCRELYGENVADVEANNRQKTVCPGAGNPEWWSRNKPNASVAGIMTHDSRFNGGGCVYFQYDPNLYVCRTGNYQGGWWADRRDKIMRRWWSSSINARVTYASDDARVNGKVPSGARVLFAHALTPVHPASLNVPVAGDGIATTIGQKGSSGYAVAQVPAEPFLIPTTGRYNVDCRTVDLKLIKNMPRVTLAFNVQGEPTTQALEVPTSLGRFAVSTLDQPVIKPAIALHVAAQPISASASVQLEPTTWVDFASQSVSAAWNGATRLPVDLSFSKPIGGRLVYRSNDASVPEDQRPTSRWNGQAPSTGSLTFAHPVSRAQSKPADRDRMSFTAASASTWGLHQAPGTASGQRSFGSGVSLSGQAGYRIQGQTVDVPLNANLPAVKLKIEGQGGGDWAVAYRLIRDDGATLDKTMALPQPEGNVYTLNLPVEEPVDDAHKHTFQLVSISKSDWSVRMPDSSANFPPVGDLYRGKEAVSFPSALKFEAFGAK